MGNCSCDNSKQMQGIRETKDVFISDDLLDRHRTTEKDENSEEGKWQEIEREPEIENTHVIRIL